MSPTIEPTQSSVCQKSNFVCIELFGCLPFTIRDSNTMVYLRNKFNAKFAHHEDIANSCDDNLASMLDSNEQVLVESQTHQTTKHIQEEIILLKILCILKKFVWILMYVI